MKLILFRGWPGSSKSTTAKRMFPNTLLLENDQYHMHNGVYDWHKENMPAAIEWCMNMTRMALENGMDVVVSNTFTRCKYIEFYKKLAEQHHAGFIVYRCTGNFKNVHGLSDSLVDNFKKSMEDWPGELFVDPNAVIAPHKQDTMEYEVFDIMTNEICGMFPSLKEADEFLAGTSDAAEMHVRKAVHAG